MSTKPKLRERFNWELRLKGLLRLHTESFCDGLLGRDAHGEKYVEAISMDWVIFRDVKTRKVFFTSFSSPEETYNCVFRWVHEN